MSKIVEPVYPFCIEGCRCKRYEIQSEELYADTEVYVSSQDVVCKNESICRMWAEETGRGERI